MSQRIKRSYGLICLKRDPVLSFLIIKRLNTYHFCDFVTGKYKKDDEKYLIKLFNGMSAKEKNDILSLKFSTLWYQIYHENLDIIHMQKNSNKWIAIYIKKKNKFDSLFLKDEGAYLRRLVTGTQSVEPPFELPKGKPNADESNIETAIREVEEETGLGATDINVLWHLSPFVETYHDCGTIYKNTYYFAETADGWQPTNAFNGTGNQEVSDVRWMNLAEIAMLVKYDESHKKIYNLLHKAANKYRKYKKKVFY